MKKDFLATHSSRVLKMNLQLFAEGDDNPESTPPAFNVDELTEEQLTVIREKHGFKTDDDVNEIIKSKHRRWQKDQLEKENRAKELSELSEEQREQAILQSEKDEFEKEKAEFRKEQLFVEKGKQLTLVGVPSSFASRIFGDTAEEILSDVKLFKQSWDEEIAKGVQEALKHSAEVPGASSSNSSTSSTAAKLAEEQNKKEKAPTTSLWD